MTTNNAHLISDKEYPTVRLNQSGQIDQSFKAVEISGSSMGPRLLEGDKILFNAASREPMDGRVFVLATEGNLSVKRLKRRQDQWWVTSDCPTYADSDYPLTVREQILGIAVESSREI